MTTLLARFQLFLWRWDTVTRVEPITGDVAADMDRIRSFYAGKTGLKSDRFGPIRLREEDTPPTAA